MKRKWPRTAYPFVVDMTAGRSGAYEGCVLVSDDGWIEFTLSQTGWYCQSDTPMGGLLSQEDRTVIQAARDTAATEVVLDLTERALLGNWFPSSRHDEIEEQLAAAKRAVHEGKL